MRKEYRFMVTDTETATLPFANEIAQGDSEKEKEDCHRAPARV